MGTRHAPLDQELETALRLVRDAHGKKISAKESEIAQLRDDLGKRIGEIKSLESKVLQLESQLGKSEKKVQDLTRAVNRLNSFKQTVMDSFADVADDLPADFSAKQRGLSLESEGGRQTPSRRADGEQFEKDEKLLASQPPRISSPGIGLRRDPTYLTSDPVSPLKRTQNGEGEDNDDDPSDNILTEDILNSTQRFSTNNSASKPPSNSKVFYSPANNAERGRSTNIVNESNTSGYPNKNNPGRESAAVRSTSSTGFGGRATPDPRRTTTNSTVNFQDEYDSGETNGVDGSISAGAEQRRSPSVRGSGRDGREFFKVARGVLSYDEFTSLLWHVRAYNNREQSRQRTFEALDQLFGRKHPQLFNQFEKMWNQ